jgi:hypothetical protein
MTTPFASMGYEPVGPVVQRLLARYLRTQRKNMRRFFQERGLYQFALRMDNIRKSNQTMLEKNRRFQKVLDAYAKLFSPAPVTGIPVTGVPTPEIVTDEPIGG